MSDDSLEHLLPRVVGTTQGAVTLRRAEPADLGAVARMHVRCSTDTVFRRYFSAVPAVSPAMQAKLLGTRLAMVAETGHEVVGLGHLAEHPGQPVELAVMVEDSWQRRGLGLALAETALDVAQEWGIDRVVCYSLQSSAGTHALLRRLRGGTLHPKFHQAADGVVRTVVPLPGPVVGLTA
jgi:GNAT superfamily N-acetyltransferase